MFWILVTGGCGFIGSNFIRHVLESRPDCAVINLDKLTYAGNLDNLKDIESRWGAVRYFFVRGDIADAATVKKLFGGTHHPQPNVIINFAAESHVDRSIVDASPFVDSNVKGTQVLLDAAREFGVRRFIQVSTDEVYGSLALSGSGRFREDFHLRPNSPYSASKAAADLLCLAYHRTYGLDLIITRCCNNYGPYQFPEKLIPLMTLNTLEGKPLPIYGDGKNVREWIHVRDHCRAIDFLLDRGVAGEIYNVGTGQEIANTETVGTILRCVADVRQIPISNLEQLITYVKDRPGHDRRYAVDSEKLRMLGWAPTMEWAEGIRQTVGWYCENQGWWEKVRSGEYRAFYQMWYGQRAETREMTNDTWRDNTIAQEVH